jgi:hypothetical protein
MISYLVSFSLNSSFALEVKVDLLNISERERESRAASKVFFSSQNDPQAQVSVKT